MKPILVMITMLLIAALAGCGAAPTPASDPTAPAATEPIPATIPAEPAATSTTEPAVEELPDVLLSFSREGGIAGLCDTLMVNMDEAYWEDCRDRVATIPLSSAVSSQLEELARTYGSFEESNEDNPGGPDSLKQSLQFSGIGDAEVTEEVAATLRQIANDLMTQAMEQEPSSQSAPTSEPVSAATALEDYRAGLDEVLGGPASPELAETLADGLAQYVSTNAMEDPEAAEDELLAVLSPGGFFLDPTARVADLDGDGRNDLLVAPAAMGLPAYAVLANIDGAMVYDLSSGQDSLFASDALSSIDDVRDVTGDKLPDAIVTSMIRGASSTTTNIRLFSFAGGDVQPIFDEQVSDWAGPAGWSLEGDGTIVTECAALGVFDHKLLMHPLRTSTYRYDATEQSFVLDSVEQEAPRTRRQAVNEAEAALQRGDTELAIERYEQAAAGEFEPDDDTPGADWRALAHLRLGMLYALTGDAERITPTLDIAAGDTSLLPMVEAIEEGYAEGGSVGAWAALSALPLYEQIFGSDSEGLGAYGTKAALFRASALGVVAYLRENPEALELTGDEMATAMREAGLPVTRLIATNLDEDDDLELVAQLSLAAPETLTNGGGLMHEVWLLDQSEESGEYGARLAMDTPDFQLAAPSEEPGFTLRQEGGDGAMRFHWDGEELYLVGEDGTLFPAADSSCMVE